MKSNQIINKIKSGKFTKGELVSIAEEAAHAISTKNHKDGALQEDI